MSLPVDYFPSTCVRAVSQFEKLGHFLEKESRASHRETVDCLIKRDRGSSKRVPGRAENTVGGTGSRRSMTEPLPRASICLLGASKPRTSGSTLGLSSRPYSSRSSICGIARQPDWLPPSRNPFALFSRYRLRSGRISPPGNWESPPATHLEDSHRVERGVRTTTTDALSSREPGGARRQRLSMRNKGPKSLARNRRQSRASGLTQVRSLILRAGSEHDPAIGRWQRRGRCRADAGHRPTFWSVEWAAETSNRSIGHAPSTSVMIFLAFLRCPFAFAKASSLAGGTASSISSSARFNVALTRSCKTWYTLSA